MVSGGVGEVVSGGGGVRWCQVGVGLGGVRWGWG